MMIVNLTIESSANFFRFIPPDAEFYVEVEVSGSQTDTWISPGWGKEVEVLSMHNDAGIEVFNQLNFKDEARIYELALRAMIKMDADQGYSE